MGEIAKLLREIVAQLKALRMDLARNTATMSEVRDLLKEREDTGTTLTLESAEQITEYIEMALRS